MSLGNNVNDGRWRISAKDAYNYVQEGLKSEINNLWQRSVFLGAFLSLFLTGYGYTLVELTKTCTWELNFVCLCISIMGLIFSCFWIAMAKGSKAWYEKYERTLFEIWSRPCMCDDDAKRLMAMGAAHGYLVDIPKSKFSNRLLFMCAGGYSPSKINIAIGQVLALGYFFAGVFHFGIFFLCDIQKLQLEIFYRLLWGVLIFCFVLFLFVFVLLFFTKSSSLQSKSDDFEKLKKCKEVENCFFCRATTKGEHNLRPLCDKIAPCDNRHCFCPQSETSFCQKYNTQKSVGSNNNASTNSPNNNGERRCSRRGACCRRRARSAASARRRSRHRRNQRRSLRTN